MVTDLDENLTTRALTPSAPSSASRATPGRGGAKDLDDYERLRDRDPPVMHRSRGSSSSSTSSSCSPTRLPDFVSGLVRIAAVGRSLGIHLVLATQRPAGIISADMRANIALRRLRVRDRADSDDVIEGPQACTISDRTPGRAWIRTAGQRLVEVQTAYVGALADELQYQTGHATGAEHTRAWRTDWRGLSRPWPVRE